MAVAAVATQSRGAEFKRTVEFTDVGVMRVRFVAVLVGMVIVVSGCGDSASDPAGLGASESTGGSVPWVEGGRDGWFRTVTGRISYPDRDLSQSPEVVFNRVMVADRQPLARPTSPTHQIVVRDPSNVKLLSVPAFVELVIDTPPTESALLFRFEASFPDPGLIGRIELLEDGVVIGSVSESDLPSPVRVVSPAGGATVSPDNLAIRWEYSGGSDAAYDVLLSGDGGRSWSPLAINHGETELAAVPEALSFDEDGLPFLAIVSTDNALVRVIARTQLNYSVDESDTPFTIGD